MKKQVRVGQCYEKDDVIYEVVEIYGRGIRIREVISKQCLLTDREKLLTWRRPFNTEG